MIRGADLHTYSGLRHLDLSQNCLASIALGALPQNLTRLTLTDNCLSELPPLTALVQLQWLSAGLNRCSPLCASAHPAAFLSREMHSSCEQKKKPGVYPSCMHPENNLSWLEA